MTDVKDILAQVEALPPLPSTSVRLMNVISDPGATVDAIVEVIRYDQGLTGEVLRLCNSAYFGLSRQVTSLNDAMICLGTVKTLQLVMAVHTNSMLTRAQPGYGLEAGVLWRQSVATALAAAQFAKRMKHPNVNLAFTAGLLHDIGKVALSQAVAEEFGRILVLINERRCAFTEAEREVLGFDHTEVGAMVAEKWALPERIVQCIRYQHEPGTLDPPDAMVDAVYLANCVCLMLGIGLGADGLSYRADEAVMQRHQLTERDLEDVGLSILEELNKVAGMFGEDAPNA